MIHPSLNKQQKKVTSIKIETILTKLLTVWIWITLTQKFYQTVESKKKRYHPASPKILISPKRCTDYINSALKVNIFDTCYHICVFFFRFGFKIVVLNGRNERRQQTYSEHLVSNLINYFFEFENNFVFFMLKVLFFLHTVYHRLVLT